MSQEAKTTEPSGIDATPLQEECQATRELPVPATDRDILKAMLGKPICILGADPGLRRKAG